jgi:predicted ATPase
LRRSPGGGYRFVAPVTLVGPSEPAVALAAPPPVRPPSPRPLLVGREAALAQLRSWWARAQQGQRQVVFVTGEPGIGKTTLVDAWCADSAAETPLWVARGQCLDHHGVGEAYLPVLEALGQLCRGSAGVSLVARLAQHAPTWLMQMPALLSTADLEALQRRALGATQERMLRELADAVDALTAEQPLVLVLEDLHWSDTATLDLVSYLARQRGPAHLLLLGTYRPAVVVAQGHALRVVAHDLVLHGYGAELALELFTEAEVAQYLAARFTGHEVPARLARLLHGRTDGNPLFLVPMVEHLVRQGWVATSAHRVTVPVGLEALEAAVPDSLRQLIEQQLVQCSPEEQRVLETAGVAGVEWSGRWQQWRRASTARCSRSRSSVRLWRGVGSSCTPEG